MMEYVTIYNGTRMKYICLTVAVVAVLQFQNR